MKTKLVFSIIAAIVALIGLISFICKTREVNIGAFIFPAIISLVFLYKYKKDK